MSDADKTKAQLVQELAEMRRQVGELEADREALLEQARRAEALNDAIRSLSGILDLEALGGTFEGCLRGYIPFDRVQITLMRDDRHFESLMTGEVLTRPASSGELDRASDWVLKHRKPLVRTDLLADDRFWVSDRLRASSLRSDMLFPLISREEAIGVVSVASYDVGAYSEADLEFLRPLAEHIAVVVDNARLYRELNKAYREVRLIYDRVSDLIFLLEVESDGLYRGISANQTCLEVTGFSEDEVIGKRIDEVLPGQAAAFVIGKCREVVQEGRPIRFDGDFDLPRGRLALETTLRPIFDEEGVCRHLLGVAHNVTERRQTDREIIRLERLHALEEMAKGFAHNFNNILVGVLGYAQIIEMQSREPETVENAKHLVDSAVRAKDLVQRLNVSVRGSGDNPPRRVASLNAIVEEAVEGTRPKWKDEAEARGISIEMTVDLRDVPAVRTAPVDLHHVLAHLISNAVDAMPDGGEIDISTRATGEGVELRVKDGGVGMDEETQKRIFEPFFTTKQDVGSGLGLSVAYRIVAGWDGRIEVESAPGEGTEIAVMLPVWREDAEEGEAGEAAAHGRRGRVLAVDDDEVVRQILGRALGDYTLDIATDGEDALDRFQAGAYDVALIDLGIPGAPGDEVALRMKEIDPQVVTVLITGWDLPEDDPRRSAFDFHIQKPFSLFDVQNLVARAAAIRREAEEQKAEGDKKLF